jgi:mannitol/fructose-specific phosphotransferase system IIA component (Ntr-type)
VSRYAFQTANRDLVEIGLMNLDNSNSQYLLRKLSSVFDQDFVVQQLIQAVEQHKNQAFAISMMRPYLHDAWVQDILLNYLADDKLSQSAAMVLTHAESSDVLKQMQKVFQQSTSNQVKQQVVFALKLNQSEQAKTILEKLAKDLDKDSSVNQWLRGFAGERR